MQMLIYPPLAETARQDRTAAPTGLGKSGLKPLATILETVRIGAIAGAAGGLAEVAWVTLYGAVVGNDPDVLARGVTSAAGISALLPVGTEAWGLIIHMVLAVALGIALAFSWRALSSRRTAVGGLFPFALASLTAVWAINFFALLPIVSPAFVHLVPYSVSLTSKLLFGLAAAAVLRRLGALALDARRASFVRRAS
jgi:hypothetical protein